MKAWMGKVALAFRQTGAWALPLGMSQEIAGANSPSQPNRCSWLDTSMFLLRFCMDALDFALPCSSR